MFDGTAPTLRRLLMGAYFPWMSPRQHMGPKAVVQSLSLLLILMRQIIKDVIELHGSQTENLKYFEWSLEYNRIN